MEKTSWDQPLVIPVLDEGQDGEARRAVLHWAAEKGYSAEEKSKLAIVVTELARNLALHTTHGGYLHLRELTEGPDGVEILAVDKGPGMTNFQACLRDGYSTAGTPGMGLGAVTRLADEFDVHSQSSIGTVMLCRVLRRPDIATWPYQTGLVNVPKRGETISGDAFAHQRLDGGRMRMIVADGLGHGPMAAEASNLAVEVFNRGQQTALVPLVGQMHQALRSSRGAALAIAEVSFAQEKVTYCGVGNITGVLVTANKYTHMVSHNGTVGGSLPSTREFTYPWTQDTLLVMASDGLKSQIKLEGYAGLQGRHPAVIAGVLHRDFNRGNDDSTVGTLRYVA